ncbi:MAG: GNAT family protein [Candidatus Eremiobacterota bacterium]
MLDSVTIKDDHSMLFGKKSCLRRPEKEDYGRIWIWWNEPEIQSLLNLHPFPPAFDDVEICYNNSIFDRTKEFFIIHAFDKKTIGTIDLYDIRWREGSSSITVMIGEKEYWSKGYGADAILTLIEFAFTELSLRRVEVTVAEYNKRAIKCYEKCGFKLEGCLRKRLLLDGNYYNQHIMALLREEYVNVLA